MAPRRLRAPADVFAHIKASCAAKSTVEGANSERKIDAARCCGDRPRLSRPWRARLRMIHGRCADGSLVLRSGRPSHIRVSGQVSDLSAMPLQNRVTPFGEIIATAARGLYMGNRGRLHDEHRVLRRQHSSETRWLVCVTEFRGRKRVPMSPRMYTELFFSMRQPPWPRAIDLVPSAAIPITEGSRSFGSGPIETMPKGLPAPARTKSTSSSKPSA